MGYKIGDKVEVLDDLFSEIKKGTKGIVTNVDKYHLEVRTEDGSFTVTALKKYFKPCEKEFKPTNFAANSNVDTKKAQKSVTKFQPKTDESVTKFQNFKIGDLVETVDSYIERKEFNAVPKGTVGYVDEIDGDWLEVRATDGFAMIGHKNHFKLSKYKKEVKKDKMDYTENIKAIMQRQHDKGLKKYGETLEDNTSLNMVQRIEHLQEELIDGLQYCEHIKAISNDNFKANDFQRAVLRTAGDDKSKYLDNAIMGLAGEVGECSDIVKKHRFQGHEFDREHFAEELGDVLWYASLAATAIDMPLDEVMKRNIEKLKERYPEGFDKARSINRE